MNPGRGWGIDANNGDIDGSGVNDLLVGSFKDGGYVVPACIRVTISRRCIFTFG